MNYLLLAWWPAGVERPGDKGTEMLKGGTLGPRTFLESVFFMWLLVLSTY